MNPSELRQVLHQCAELSLKEFETKEVLLNELKKHRGKVIEIEDSTSLMVLYDFHCRETWMIRAEMDGLPIVEKGHPTYTSKHQGVMHACGHDGHMAILCALSQKLSELTHLDVNVLLVFQSAEETGAGAQMILHHPEFLKICPDAAVALHVMPHLPHGSLFVKQGIMLAGGREIDVKWHGTAAHCAHPELGNDALKKAVGLMHDLYRQQFEDGLMSFNLIRAGQVRNQIADECLLQGTMRFQTDKAEKQMIRWISEKTKDAELMISTGYPALRCSAKMTQKAIEAGAQMLNETCWICDDFAFYAQCIPSVYVFIGIDSPVDLHHECFDFKDDLIETGVEFLLKMISKHKSF